MGGEGDGAHECRGGEAVGPPEGEVSKEPRRVPSRVRMRGRRPRLINASGGARGADPEAREAGGEDAEAEAAGAMPIARRITRCQCSALHGTVPRYIP